MRSKDLFGAILRPARALAAFVPVALAVLVLASGPALAQSPDALAEINRQIGKHAAKGETDKVVPLAEHYVALARQAHGEDHPEYATAITWLGWAYQNQRRFGEAEPLLEQAVQIRETAFGPEHALVATSLNNLAGLYQEQGRDADAEPLIARANAIRLKAAGLDDLEALPRRIQELQWSGETAEAAALAGRYVTLAEERHGEKPGLVPALMEAASLFEQQGDTAKAEALLKQAIRIREAAFGPDSLEVAECLEALGRVYQTAGRYENAEVALKHALDIRVAALGERNEQVIDTMQVLAGVSEAAGRKAEAEKLYARAQTLQEKTKRRYAYRRPEPSYAVVKVFYATDRKNTGAADPAAVYGGDRGPLTFGTATVSIPRDHRMGVLETPSIWRLEWSNDPERYVVLLSVDETDEAKFFEEVSDRVREAPGKSAFVFVHGYNVTFADAARPTAQMTYDLGFAGAPVFYSWPSQARYAAYKVDETNAEWARHDFKNFLKAFAEQSDAERIYLIGRLCADRVEDLCRLSARGRHGGRHHHRPWRAYDRRKLDPH